MRDCRSHMGQLPDRVVPGIRLGIASRMPSATTSDTVQTFQRGNSSIAGASVVRRLAAAGRAHFGKHRLHHPMTMAGGELDLHLMIADLGHLADVPARGDHLIALLDGPDASLVLLHPLLLR